MQGIILIEIKPVMRHRVAMLCSANDETERLLVVVSKDADHSH